MQASSSRHPDTTMDNSENLTLREKSLRFYFVSEDGEQHDDQVELNRSYNRIAQRFSGTDCYSWLSTDECIRLARNETLTRRTVFFFANFVGDAFDHLRLNTSAMILGPRCIIDCYDNDSDLPNVPSPIFNVTLRDNFVCTSGLRSADKEHIERLVHYMGGHFNGNELSANTTYLVTATTMSVKYEKAVAHGIRPVTIGWVDALWQLSQTEHFIVTETNATAQQLWLEHRIPLFYKLNITSTGIGTPERAQLKTLIESNGGTYHGTFKSELIDIVIVRRTQTDSDKFRAAIKCGKTCLTPEWFVDSVASGFTLATEAYRVDGDVNASRKLVISTPSKVAKRNGSGADGAGVRSDISFNPDNTNLSAIGMGNVTVNESRMSTAAPARRSDDKSMGGKSEADNVTAYKQLLASVSVQQAKKSGAFLDGCNVFLCGFTADESDKLAKILSNASATRFDEYDSRVEYVIVGNPSTAEFQLMRGLNSRTLVTLCWLIACIEQKCPASERSYLYALPTTTTTTTSENVAKKSSTAADRRHNVTSSTTTALEAAAALDAAATASPASKKNMASMSSSFIKMMPRRLYTDEAEEKAKTTAESDLLQQYLVGKPQPSAVQSPPANKSETAFASNKSATTSNTTTKTNTTNEDEDNEDDADATDAVPYFANLTFHVTGFMSDSEDALNHDIESAGGRIVSDSYTETVDYVIVPMDIFCADQVPMRARHMVNEYWPTDCEHEKQCVEIQYFHRPFEWQNEEHQPLVGMVLVLTTYSGSERSYLANVGRILGADVQERYARPQRPLLICPRPEGAKYNGAIKWALPVVSRDWLLECARRARKVGMKAFLVGASVAPADEPDDSVSLDEESSAEPEVIATAAAVSYLTDKTAIHKPVAAHIDGSGTDSLQITDIEAPPQPQPVGRSNDMKTPAEKRQRSEDIAVDSPQLKHRRLSAITNMARKDSPLVSASQSPQPADYATNLKKQLSTLATPCRDLVFREVMALHEKETPETKRRQEAISTPDLIRSPLAAEFRTPALERRLQEARDRNFLGWVPSPAPMTPFEEVQRRFWKKALGDDYMTPTQKPADDSQRYHNMPVEHVEAAASSSAGCGEPYSSTQAEFAAAAPIASSTQVEVHTTPSTAAKENIATANTHVKRLSDFIQRQKNADGKTPTKTPIAAALEIAVAGIETQTQHPLGPGGGSGAVGAVGSTEPFDAVVWRDPAVHEPNRFRRMMQHRGTAKFNISCVDAVRLERIAAAIVRLGGEVCDNRNGYDPTCTHVLCEKPSRSEKIFSAIAAGKWLLTLRYVEDSEQADGFLDEEAYEFGNPLARELFADAAGAPIAGMDETGRAAYRWRKQLQALRLQLGDTDARSKPIGVFSEFRVILQTNKKASFRNLLEAGAGIVLDVTQPYATSKEALTATHCILDTRNKLSSVDRQALQKAGVACVNIMYLQAYVSSDTVPDPKDFAA